MSTSVTPSATSGAIQAHVPGRTCGSIKAVYYALEPGVIGLIARLVVSDGHGVRGERESLHGDHPRSLREWSVEVLTLSLEARTLSAQFPSWWAQR